MPDSSYKQPDPNMDGLWQFANTSFKHQALLHKIGYGFLFFTLFDLGTTVFPTRFTDPIWELEFVRAMIERVIVPILAYAFIFIGGIAYRSKKERLVIKGLSWLALIVSLSYLPLIGLGVSSAIRLDRQNDQALTARVNESRVDLVQIQAELEQVSNIDQLKQFIAGVEENGNVPEINNVEQFNQIKQELGKSLSAQIQQVDKLKAQTQLDRRKSLAKKMARYLLGAVVAGVLFFIIWKETAWARR